MKPYRGQGAVEYMMTYGWAILVVLVAGVFMWQYGMGKPPTPTPDKRGFSEVTPLDWSMLVGQNDMGNLTVIFQNNAGTLVEIADDGFTAANMVAGGSGSCTLNTALPMTDFRPGDKRALDFVDCPLLVPTVGEYYRVNVTISYQAKSGLPHRSNGVIWGPIG